jgi:predicted Zn-dependent peptidase
MDALSPVYHKTLLPNGIRVVTERHPLSRAVSVGIWVETGTRDEKIADAGISHFVEHLVFKRTKTRTAYQIARELEEVGGEINAYTSREYTCYFTHALKDHLELSLDVLSDLACRPLFTKSDIEKEKGVVLQEIQMSEDNLEDYIFDLYFQKIYGATNSMGWPILGTEQSIQTMKRSQILDYFKRRYSGDRIIVSVAGAVEHEAVVRLAEKLVKPKLKRGPKAKRKKPRIIPFRQVVEKPSEQVHILMGFPAASFQDRMRFEAYIVSALLGGGMTSKLYQSVREKRGLVYTIYSQLTTFVDTGLMLIYAGARTQNAKKVIELTLEEIAKIKKNGVTERELDLFKTQVTGQILLSSDDIENRMNSLGVNEMVFGKYRPVDEIIAEINKVTAKSLDEYIDKYLDPKRMGLLLLGACPKQDFEPFVKSL